jgi:hypothetical protein
MSCTIALAKISGLHAWITRAAGDLFHLAAYSRFDGVRFSQERTSGLWLDSMISASATSGDYASFHFRREPNKQVENSPWWNAATSSCFLAAQQLDGPLAVRAQQPERIRHVGVLTPYTEQDGVDPDDGDEEQRKRLAMQEQDRSN